MPRPEFRENEEMNQRVLYAIVMLVGLVLRLREVHHGVDGSIQRQLAWRECDSAMVARNFVRDGMNPVRPEVDFSGDRPGYVESEFPFLPYGMALASKVGLPLEESGRWIALAASLGALLLFHRIAARCVSPLGALAATACFALAPLPVGVATSLQPDGLMLLFCLAGVLCLLRYFDSRAVRDLVATAAATALAILAKGTAVHIGWLYLAMWIGRDGVRGVFRSRAVLLAGASLAPGILWYLHARGYYLQYGNSLGISSEYHFAGLDLFTNRYFLTGIFQNQIQYVWTPAALPIVLLGLLRSRADRLDSGVRLAVSWWLATLAFFLFAARTCADDWAFYYHLISAPAAALLFGCGVASIAARNPEIKFRLPAFVVAATVLALPITILSEFYSERLGRLQSLAMLLLCAGALVLWATLRFFLPRPMPQGGLGRAVLLVFLLFLVALTFLRLGHRIGRTFAEDQMVALHADAIAMRSAVADAPRIAVTVESRFDSDGHAVDPAASYMFYWLDKKGFLITHEDLSLEYIESLRARGATRLVAERRHLDAVYGIEKTLEQRYRVLVDGSKARLFDLSAPR